ncbi:MAG: hypothetical protein EA382_09785 [Spirochaetaceae bacterium]|nr:MAG: hypothetical protein EA382_09785 [Spirochaetaceae bacterium]
MTTTLRRFGLAAALVALVATQSYSFDAASLNRVTFVNRTGYDFVYLFFSPGDSEYWGPDILGATRTLNNGERLSFFISYPDRSNTFDFMAIDVDGDAYIIWDYVIRDGRESVIEITFDLFDGAYDLASLALVNLRNDTGYDMYYVFFSPGDSDMWGVDMLDATTILGTGEALSLFVPVAGPTRYDFMGVDEDGDVYEFWVDLRPDQMEYTFAIELSDLR